MKYLVTRILETAVEADSTSEAEELAHSLSNEEFINSDSYVTAYE